MQIAFVVAMTEKGVIGYQNKLPWHLPEELKYFKKITEGKPIIMGLSTFQSLGSKPLPNRHNIIMTHAKDFTATGCAVVHSIAEALQAAETADEVMVIGGANVFKQFLPLVKRIYLTIIHQDYPGDTYFPSIDWAQWKMISEEKKTDFTLKVFEKGVYR